MPCPTRKLRTLIQYAALALMLVLTGYAVSIFSKNKQLEPLEQQLRDNPGKQEEKFKDFVKGIEGRRDVEVKEKVEEKAEIHHDPMELIDWHNWTHIKIESERVGPGEQGKAVQISPGEEKQNNELFHSNGFSGFASDKISLDRSIPDIRNKGCKAKKYLAGLPTVAVVIPFYNEHWTTLLRTFHSVINRSPEHLLKEIILVDDFSNKNNLKQELDDYVEGFAKVSVVRLPERGGLITARLAGAKKSTAEVIIFLDSHTEANVNWLPPLLEPIAKDYRTAVCPFIDVVDFNNFQYRAQDEGARGAFDWQLYYKRLPLLPEDLKHPTEPFKSPVMAGGLFAISAKWFWEIGGYDPGLEIWGGEQYELSFKLWQCGGTMVDAPCSRVGHIYRKYSPFSGAGKGDYLGRNYKRVAAVWMDEYAEHIYKRRPHYRNMDPGDISEQVALRKRLNCKPFKWFMKEIAFDLPKHYPPVEPPDFLSGEFRSRANKDFCVDAKFKGVNDRIGMDKCSKDNPGSSGEQRFALTWRKDIRPKKRGKVCWDVSSSDPQAPVLLYDCHTQGGNQFWRYDEDYSWILHGGNPRCLDCNPATKELYVSKCDKNSETQRWDIENVDFKALAKWEDPTEDLF